VDAVSARDRVGILMVVALAMLGGCSRGSSEQGIAPEDLACTWIDGPTLAAGGTRCEGVVHCRLARGYSFMPLVRKVRCPPAAGACVAEVCAASVLANERSARRR
jgi:hypothetical protein